MVVESEINLAALSLPGKLEVNFTSLCMALRSHKVTTFNGDFFQHVRLSTSWPVSTNEMPRAK